MSRTTFALVVVCVISLISGGASQHSAVRAQEATSGLDALKVLAGAWKAEGEVFDTEFSKATKDTATLHNDCWQSGEFYACDQIVDGVSRALIVFSFNEKDGTYNNYAIPAGGLPAGPGGILTIAGKTWTYASRPSDDAKPPYFRTVNEFDGRSTIHYKIEFTRDNKTWTKTREGIERRVE
jgi:hypothetical protein